MYSILLVSDFDKAQELRRLMSCVDRVVPLSECDPGTVLVRTRMLQPTAVMFAHSFPSDLVVRAGEELARVQTLRHIPRFLASAAPIGDACLIASAGLLQAVLNPSKPAKFQRMLRALLSACDGPGMVVPVLSRC